MAPDMREPSFDAKALNVLRRDIRVTISECAAALGSPVEFHAKQHAAAAGGAL